MRLWVSLLCGLLIWNTSVVAAESEKINLETLIKQFNSVVFVHEHGKSGREAKPLVKWKGPILYSSTGSRTGKQVDEFFKLMKRIRLLTNLKMRMAKTGEKANLVVNFMPKAELAKKVKKGINCYGTLTVSGRTLTIKNVEAFIPSDRPDKTTHCLIEETVQLFGLTNDSTVIKNSMFYEHSKRNSLSVSDQILLKALYDPRLRPGMTKKQAQPALRVVLNDIIQKAIKKKK